MDQEIKITAVKSYRIPGYPVQEEAVRSPNLLKALPKHWRAKPVMCMALVFTITSGLCACMDRSEGPGLQIPVFEHGDGRSSFGCDSVSPPVFLSEEEAAQVIREEAILQGVDFSGSKTIHGEFPATSFYSFRENHPTPGTWNGTLDLDGYDSQIGIGFEYVSEQDFSAWSEDKHPVATIGSYDLKGTAERMSGMVSDVAVFYDPTDEFKDFDWSQVGMDTEQYQEYLAQFEAEQKEQMKEQLREQVRDFLTWLAGEGVI